MVHSRMSQLSGFIMQTLENIVPLRDYCRKYPWPRLPQWHHWIYARAPIAKACVKKVGGRYLVDLSAFHKYVESASLEEKGVRR
jgi:hypothetical protein